MAKFICKICGKEFDRVGNGVYCKGPHYRPCPVCGKPVAFHLPSEPAKCCSDSCVRILADRSKSKKAKVCKECGKIFYPHQASQVYCSGPHTSVCVVCGKTFEYSVRPSEKPETCSKICQEKLRSITTFNRYGVKNVSELESVRKKISEANSSEEVVAKRRKTSLERWGVDNPAKNPVVANKMSQIMSSKRYLEAREATCLERYGVPYPMRNESVKERRALTNQQRYRTSGHVYSREELSNMMIDGSKVDDYILFKDSPREFIESHFDEHPTINQLESILGVTNTPIYSILIKNGCRDLLKSSFSSMKNDIFEFLRNFLSDDDIVRCDRSAISPYELDLYLPKHKIGIECNPVCTHNSSFLDPWGGSPKDRNYHMNKSKLAHENGLFLFHVFGYEWIAKPEIIKSMILNILGLTPSKIGARSTTVDILSYSECKEFLNNNHRQGSCGSSIRLGLRHKHTHELLSVMTFGKLRHTMGDTKSDKNIIELSRFCNKLSTTVVGGASKLFKYFLDNYSCDEVVSFSDISHTRGNLYNLLGFKQSGIVDPSYTWVDKYDNIYYNRVSCQKSNLRKLFNEPNIDIVNKTEKQIMMEHGFAQVYDSGKIKWTYTRE